MTKPIKRGGGAVKVSIPKRVSEALKLKIIQEYVVILLQKVFQSLKGFQRL